MEKKNPLVSIICLCHNHETYVREALISVLNQDYASIELIIVDDGSTDKSVDKIESFLKSNPLVAFIKNDLPKGNCTAFNQGLAKCSGEFVIDLAADDVLCSQRVSKGVESMIRKGVSYGVNHTMATLIDSNGKVIGLHDPKVINKAVSGNLYQVLIEKFLISAPTMMMRKSVLDELGGYDESLAYEDFDFWVKSSRNHLYDYTDEILIKKRIHKENYSKKQYSYRSKQMYSTYYICLKILHLNQSREEFLSLKKRLKYEIKKCIQYLNFKLLLKYTRLYITIIMKLRK